MKCMFKIWNFDRTKKAVVISEPNLMSVIAKAVHILKIKGSSLVLEEDGSVVTDDDVLEFLTMDTRNPSQVLLLLESDQKWTPAEKFIETEVTSENNLDTSNQTNKDFNENSSMTSADSNDQKISSKRNLNPEKHQYSNSSQSLTEEPPSKIPARRESTSEVDTNVETLSTNDTPDWENFKITWPHEGELYFKELNSGNRTKFLVNTFVVKVVDQMRNLSLDLRDDNFVCVAKKMVSDYPKIFKDEKGDGETFGEGYYVIKKQLRNRFDYLQRCSGDNFLKRTKKVNLSMQKLLIIAQAGCKNWQPEGHPDGETNESVTEKKNMLQEFAVTGDLDFDLASNLNATYTAQRFYLNNLIDTPMMADVILEWPVLILQDVLFWHYQKLMDHEISQITGEMVKKYEKIFTFNDLKFHSKTMHKPRKLKKSKAKKNRNPVQSSNQNGNDKETDGAVAEEEVITLLQFEKSTEKGEMCKQIVDIVANHFRENLKVFCMECQVSILNCQGCHKSEKSKSFSTPLL